MTSMVDARRAYRRWFLRRMSWLLPGLTAALVVFARLATEQSLEWWLRLPALVIAGGVALLFMGLALVPVLVLCASGRGDRRRSQSLRREFQSYPVLALMSLSLALVLLSVPLLLGPSDPAAPHPARTQAGPRSHRSIPAPLPEPAPLEPILQVMAAEASPAQPPPLPLELLPAALVAAPDVPALAPELPGNPIPPAPVQADLPAGEELFTFRFRPDPERLDYLRVSSEAQRTLDRGGLPWGDDPSDWPQPELQIDVTIVPDSRGWYGAIYGTAVDVPVQQETSIRASYFIASLNDGTGDFELEASVVWHRMTVEVEQRLAGYTRRATFDLAVRGGLSVDRVDTNEAKFAVQDQARLSPWVGIEVAFWQQDGLGVVMQGGHSFGLNIEGASARATDLRLELKVDLSERVSLQVGWRYIAVRFHDQGGDGAPSQDFGRSCSGPVAGLGIRF